MSHSFVSRKLALIHTLPIVFDCSCRVTVLVAEVDLCVLVNSMSALTDMCCAWLGEYSAARVHVSD